MEWLRRLIAKAQEKRACESAGPFSNYSLFLEPSGQAPTFMITMSVIRSTHAPLSTSAMRVFLP